MMKIKNRTARVRLLTVLTLLALLLSSTETVKSCTSVIISGEYTPDGRPLMWKHRDTGELDNKILYMDGGKYPAMALVNTPDSLAKHIWTGYNSEGFSIMNTASYNLNYDTIEEQGQEGAFMKKALLNCSSLEDFEKLLDTAAKPLEVEANFGVIDAHGGAAYYETGNFTYTKIDVNDPKVAPHGYVVRTNYSFTGKANDGAGYIRFSTAERLFYEASGENNLSVEFIINEMSRSLANSLTGQSKKQWLQKNASTDNFVYFDDCINRYFTSSSVLVQGVKPEESAEFTTMWTILGFPLTSVVTPVWLTESGQLPEILTAPVGKEAPLCNMALKLKERMVPSTRGSTKYYINTTKVMNKQGTGITQQLQPLHSKMLTISMEKLEKWRENKAVDEKEITNYYKWISQEIEKEYNELFDL
ncbi:MAG: hypothetical protein ACQESX_08895 [Bacteroidota bacterium]